MRSILSIIMILAAVGGFIVYIVPTYSDIKAIGKEKAEYSELLDNARKLAETRDQLLQKYNSISPADIEKLQRMLPANPDNVKLILEIDGLAKSQNLLLQNVKIQQSDDQKNAAVRQAGKATNPDIGTLTLEFSTTGSYPGYVAFISSLERNLRIMNLKKITFIAPEDKTNYQYQTTVETYWVK
jgi:Tfp pilus assembly protein PilO